MIEIWQEWIFFVESESIAVFHVFSAAVHEASVIFRGTRNGNESFDEDVHCDDGKNS